MTAIIYQFPVKSRPVDGENDNVVNPSTPPSIDIEAIFADRLVRQLDLDEEDWDL